MTGKTDRDEFYEGLLELGKDLKSLQKSVEGLRDVL